MMNPNATQKLQHSQIIEFIKNLKKGDKVKILWDQIYVNNNGIMYPDDIVRKIELLTICYNLIQCVSFLQKLICKILFYFSIIF